MNSTCFKYSIDNGVAHLEMARPNELNTMNLAFWKELPALMDSLSESGDVSVMVISGQGKHFTAGLDLNSFSLGNGVASHGPKDGGRARDAAIPGIRRMQDTFTALERARFPVIAAIHGACIGGGVDMVTACDIRLCSENAYFIVQETNIGLAPDVGTLQRLPRTMSPALARELVYTGRRFAAKEAHAAGFVNHTYDTPEATVQAALEMAREIASKSPLVTATAKAMLNYAADHTIAESLDYNAVYQTAVFTGVDTKEAFAAQQEKRTPKYEGLAATQRSA